MKTLTIEDLSILIKKSPATIRSDMVRNPGSLPPWFKFPGSKKPVWLEDTVLAWIRKWSE